MRPASIHTPPQNLRLPMLPLAQLTPGGCFFLSGKIFSQLESFATQLVEGPMGPNFWLRATQLVVAIARWNVQMMHVQVMQLLGTNWQTNVEADSGVGLKLSSILIKRTYQQCIPSLIVSSVSGTGESNPVRKVKGQEGQPWRNHKRTGNIPTKHPFTRCLWCLKTSKRMFRGLTSV